MNTTLNNEQIEKLTNSLVRCDAMKHPGNRNSVVERLPDKISAGITRKEGAKEDAISIVRRCAQFPDGVDALMKAVGFRDSGTTTFMDAEEAWNSIKKEITGSGKRQPSHSVENPTVVDMEKVVAPDAGNPSISTTGQAIESSSVEKSANTTPGTWEKIAAFAFGVVFLLLMIVIAIFIKNPTHFQYKFFQVALALAAAGVGAVIPGLIQVEVNQKYMPLIRAGGAIALFILVYMVDPPGIG